MCDTGDNCMLVSNPPASLGDPQIDTDGDGVAACDTSGCGANACACGGDACDQDDDNDGVFDASDIASLDFTRCRDLDGDGCDDCTHTWTAPPALPVPPKDGFGPLPDYDVNADGTDTDATDGVTDGMCDVNDTDDDNDGVLDGDDNA